MPPKLDKSSYHVGMRIEGGNFPAVATKDREPPPSSPVKYGDRLAAIARRQDDLAETILKIREAIAPGRPGYPSSPPRNLAPGCS